MPWTGLPMIMLAIHQSEKHRGMCLNSIAMVSLCPDVL